MTVLYLHGLESKLNPAKRTILEKYGKVIAPNLDYYNDPNVFDLLLNLIHDQEIDVVIGSSMGGFMGYYIANTIQKPALLFNPALPYRSVLQNVPELDILKPSRLLHFALGDGDEIIKASDNLKWISENRNALSDIKINIHSQMEHQIPVAIFEIEVGAFLSQF